MFVEAIEKASAFTFPLIISNQYQDGSVSSSLASFIILNEEGWLLTAAHTIQDTSLHQMHLKEYQEYIQGEGTVLNPKWILNHSLWFGADHHRVHTFHIWPENDLAIAKIEHFNPGLVREYPVFISPDAVKSGRSLCKLGFPFYDIQAVFTENTFRYDPGLFPIPRFPYEGMLTRIISGGAGLPAAGLPGADHRVTGHPGAGPAGSRLPAAEVARAGQAQSHSSQEILWIETSSPGLRGQSGGPVFDTAGRVWGIQSMTRHLPLGFSPSIKKDGVTVVENQFINLGWCAHVQAIMNFLDQHGIKYYRTGDTM